MPDQYRSPYTGTIADLMSRKASIDAETMRGIADARARQQQASGQAWGGAIQNIGNAVSGTLRDYLNYKAQAPQREMQALELQQARDNAAAQKEQQFTVSIGRAAQQVAAAGYNPAGAEQLFKAIASKHPEHAENFQRALMQPETTKAVIDTLIQQMPGYKAPEGYTLKPGESRFDASGRQIANLPEQPKAPESFTLGEGQTRFGPDGKPIASGAPRQAPTVNLQRDTVLLDGKPQMVVFNPQTGAFLLNGQDVSARVKPLPTQAPQTPQKNPIPVVGPNGETIYVLPEDAVGKRVPSTRENPTEDERKTAGFYQRMMDASRIMDETEDALTPQDIYQIQSLPQEDLIGLVSRGRMSEPAKRYIRAMMQFTEARLRADSGAAISAGEYAGDRQVYAKQYGETPKLNADRRQARSVAMDALKTRAGRAMPKEATPQTADPLGIRPKGGG